MRKILFPIFLVIIFLSGCGKGISEKDKDVAAYVNKEPILKSELQRELALRAKQDPSFKLTPESEAEQLETIINKKIIIQQAMKQGLAENEKFVNTIKAFWEQTLVRDFLDFKKRSFGVLVSVTEDEIRKYYDDMSDKVTFKVMKDRDKAIVDRAYDSYLTAKDLVSFSYPEVGPVSRTDITSEGLAGAFDLPVGDAVKFEELPYYYLAVVVARQKSELPPLDEIRPEIERRIAVLKESKLFNDWLTAERKKADVKIAK